MKHAYPSSSKKKSSGAMGIRDKKLGKGRGAKNTYGKYGGPAVVPGDFVTGRKGGGGSARRMSAMKPRGGK